MIKNKNHWARIPLGNTSRDYYVLLTEENEQLYFFEALMNSGCTINLMAKSTYLNLFNTYKRKRDRGKIGYGRLNKSLLSIISCIMSGIKIRFINCKH
jgi:hypothetical protein